MNHGWLPPLLDVIRHNRTRVIVPRIDSIDPRTIDYVPWDHAALGTLTWSMDFTWKLASNVDDEATQPMATATAIGCVLAVDRKFFFDVGAFDDGMLIWGGENLELSIRAWTCAGGVHIALCSRAAHLFRRTLPYRVPVDRSGLSVKLRNYRRLVNVWLDDYRKFYYATESHQRPAHPSSLGVTFSDEVRSIDDRRRLRQRLKCRGFDWYLQNVATDLVIPDVNSRYFGQLRNAHGRICASSAPADDVTLLPVTECGWRDRSQTFELMQNGTLVDNRNRKCLTVSADGYAALSPCNCDIRSQIWTYGVVDSVADSDPTMQNASTTLLSSLEEIDARKPMGKLWTMNERNERVCLTQVTWEGRRQVLGMMPCRVDDNKVTELFQYWIFTYRLDWTGIME